MTEEFKPDLTQALKIGSPPLYWLRKNFSLASLLTIAGVLASAGGYIISLRTRVILLEHEVVTIREVVPDSKALAVLTQRVDEHDRRLAELEDNWNTAVQNSQKPITIGGTHGRSQSVPRSR